MNKIGLVILTALVVIYGCNSEKESERPYSGPQIIETTGDVVPMDSMENPVVLEVDHDKLEKVRAGKPKIVPLRSNVYPAGKPKVVKAGKPRVCTPGQDTFLLPKIVKATFKIVVAETPEIVLAKEASSKDENPYSFSSLGVKNGMKSNCITSIFEDKSGNIWIGMCGESGVTKYDGKYFTNYNQNKFFFSAISILEDKKGNIWFGGGRSVLKYDGKYITNYTNAEVVDVGISSLFEDRKGNIWMGTVGKGLIKFDGKSMIYFTQKQGLSNDFINDIIEDKYGNIWIGTDGGLSKFDGKAFYNYGEITGLYDSVNSLLEDEGGHLWVGTYGGGLFKFIQDTFVQYTVQEGLCDNKIYSITYDQSKTLWVYGESQGMSKFDGTHFTNFTDNEGLNGIGYNSMLSDNHGQMWFGTQTQGVVKYSGNLFQHLNEKDGILSNFIGAISQDELKDLWFGGLGGGVSMLANNSIKQVSHMEGLFNEDIWSICIDKSGQLWIGTFFGLIKYDGNYFTKMTPKNGQYETSVYSILEDFDGNVWIGTNNGLIKFSGKTKTNFSEKFFSTKINIGSIIEDKKRNIWLGTSTGVSLLTPIIINNSVKYSITNFTDKHGLGKGDVRSILEDSFGNIWVGTMNGLSRITQSNKKSHYFITNITTKEGLSSNSIFSIYQDKSENIWVGTDLGLDKLMPEKLEALYEKIKSKSIGDEVVFLKNYSPNDGFLGIGVLGGKTIQEDKNGKIWIGSLDRLTIYDPKGESSDTTSPNVQLIGISIYNENIDWIDLANNKDTTITLGNGVRFRNFDFDSTGKWHGVPQNLSLASNNNYVTFRFVGITQNQPHKVKYKYRLLGLEENWSALTDKNEAQYGNLTHGRYTFIVKSMNSDGLWSEPVGYTFTIRPPWYRTWWSYGIYLLLISYAGWKLHRYQKAKTIKKEREKAQERELEHAKEIEIAYTKLGTAHENLKTSQAQLIQSEKMASLGELTAGIAHEIQNPLNFVNNFSELSVDLAKELKEEVEKLEIPEKDKEYVSEIINDLSQNQEKINHHGKRASSIVKGMLEHSRKSSGTKEPTDINALANEYLRLAYHGLKAKDKDFNAEFITDFDPNLPKIDIIPQDIGRVLLNLINNAFYAVNERSKKAEPGYQPTVSITTQLTADSQLLIAVKDNGSGIPNSIKEKIFQPFFTTKPTGQGTGLGLSLSYDIVKAHGGELRVKTLPAEAAAQAGKDGEGSTFIISIPAN